MNPNTIVVIFSIPSNSYNLEYFLTNFHSCQIEKPIAKSIIQLLIEKRPDRFSELATRKITGKCFLKETDISLVKCTLTSQVLFDNEKKYIVNTGVITKVALTSNKLPKFIFQLEYKIHCIIFNWTVLNSEFYESLRKIFNSNLKYNYIIFKGNYDIYDMISIIEFIDCSFYKKLKKVKFNKQCEDIRMLHHDNNDFSLRYFNKYIEASGCKCQCCDRPFIQQEHYFMKYN